MLENFIEYLKNIDVVIIGGGTFPRDSILKAIDLRAKDIVCVDSGLDYAIDMGLPIKVAIGDFDSVKNDLDRQKKEKDFLVYDFPVDKDFTDMELALNYVLEKGYKKPLILAATGTRLDHTISNIFLLKSFLKKGIAASVLDDHNLVLCVDRTITIKPTKAYLSLLSTDEKTVLNLFNVRWDLKQHRMKFGSSLTVSNEFLDTEAVLQIIEGSVFLFISID